MGDNTNYKTLKIKEGAEEHLINGEVGTGAKGVIGAHNFNQFKKALVNKGFNVDDCIVNIKKHPMIKGIYEIEYKLPARTRELEIILNRYKKITYPKTVYDPSIISDATMIEWANEAMDEGIKAKRISGRTIVGYSNNGLCFVGYINLVTGEITNFFPTITEGMD